MSLLYNMIAVLKIFILLSFINICVYYDIIHQDIANCVFTICFFMFIRIMEQWLIVFVWILDLLLMCLGNIFIEKHL